jgi:hypothetical protein
MRGGISGRPSADRPRAGHRLDEVQRETGLPRQTSFRCAPESAEAAQENQTTYLYGAAETRLFENLSP